MNESGAQRQQQTREPDKGKCAPQLPQCLNLKKKLKRDTRSKMHLTPQAYVSEEIDHQQLNQQAQRGHHALFRVISRRRNMEPCYSAWPSRHVTHLKCWSGRELVSQNTGLWHERGVCWNFACARTFSAMTWHCCVRASAVVDAPMMTQAHSKGMSAASHSQSGSAVASSGHQPE